MEDMLATAVELSYQVFTFDNEVFHANGARFHIFLNILGVVLSCFTLQSIFCTVDLCLGSSTTEQKKQTTAEAT